MLLLGERSSVSRAVGISNGVLFFLVVRGAVVVLVVFPLSNIGGVASYGRGNLGLPTGKDVVFPHRLVGCTDPCRRSNAGQQILMLLLGERSSVSHAVGVGYGVLRSHAQNIVLGGSVHHSPLAIYPFQIDNALVCLAGIGKVRTLLVIKLLHILVEGIDLHFAGILAVVTNRERAVDQTEGLAAVAGFAVGADDLYRIAAQQFLDVFLAGLRGRGVALNVDLSGGNSSSHKNPIPTIRIPGREYRHNGERI